MNIIETIFQKHPSFFSKNIRILIGITAIYPRITQTTIDTKSIMLAPSAGGFVNKAFIAISNTILKYTSVALEGLLNFIS